MWEQFKPEKPQLREKLVYKKGFGHKGDASLRQNENYGVGPSVILFHDANSVACLRRKNFKVRLKLSLRKGCSVIGFKAALQSLYGKG